jgi:hypothetical protein
MPRAWLASLLLAYNRATRSTRCRSIPFMETLLLFGFAPGGRNIDAENRKGL